MDSLLQDIRYAIRVCVRTPGFTAVAVLALALGIGANTAIFTIVNAVLLERLPFRDPNGIVALWEENARRPGRSNVVGPSQFIRWGDRSTSFERMAAFVDTRANLTGGGNPEEVIVLNVTAGFFPILGVPPLLGRPFSDSENTDPQSSVVILSADFWQRRVGGGPQGIGRRNQPNSRAPTPLGVMPPDFRLRVNLAAQSGKPADLWGPMVFAAGRRGFRGRHLGSVARLK